MMKKSFAKESWLPWFGGECPTKAGVEVEIVMRDKRKEKCKAGEVDWGHDDNFLGDVIAYRVLEAS